jgi:hypothetical protein
VRAWTALPETTISPAEMGSLNRRGPQLPGFTYMIPSRSCTEGLCDDHAHARGPWIDVEFGEIVNHVDEYVAHSDQFGVPQALGPGRGIIVAPDCDEGSHGGQVIENLGITHIAAVHDVVAADEKRTRFGSEQPMGI